MLRSPVIGIVVVTKRVVISGVLFSYVLFVTLFLLKESNFLRALVFLNSFKVFPINLILYVSLSILLNYLLIE
mgnify:CR=1 FL=1